MRIAGIIAEYDPFHTGHTRHIAETRRVTGCDYVVVCMDGHFTQRGEPSQYSKWARACMALSCGADAVFELPALFAVRTADVFARGGVAILGALGVDDLSFGSECDDIDMIRALAKLRDDEPDEVASRIREKLDEGQSHARARGDAVAEYLGVEPEIINRPNQILASEYVRSIDALYPDIRPVPIKRLGGYHDEVMGEYASASAIRAAFQRGDADNALRYIPEAARRYAAPDALHSPDDMLLMRLRDMTIDDLRILPDVSEGLEQRLFRLCREHSTREALLENMKCKRYTRARLSRLLTHALLGLTNEMTKAHPMPSYARLIGMRAGAEPLIREIKRRSNINIAVNATELRDDPIFEFECRATDLWALLHDDAQYRLPGREFTEKFIRL